MDNKKKKNKILLQIVSVFVAVVLWIIVGYTENPSIDVNIKSVKIEYSGLMELENRGYTIDGEEKPSQISVGLRGKRSDLIKILGRVSASVDLSQVNQAGTYELDIDVNVPVNTVQVIRQKTTQEVVIEPYVTQEVPVVVKQTSEDKERDILIKSEPVSGTLEITGAQSLVNRVGCAEINADISDINTDSTQKYPYRLINKTGGEIDKKLRVQTPEPDLLVKHTVYTPVTVPIKTDIPDALRQKYEVNVKGISKESVTLGVRNGEEVIAALAVFSDGVYESGSREYTIPIAETENTYIPEEDKTVTVKAEFTERKESSATLPVQITGGESNSNIMIDVRIAAADGVAVYDNVSASVDLTGLTAGTHDVPVVFWTTEKVFVIGTYTVRVTI
jgi:YbbR domain-containing protein